MPKYFYYSLFILGGSALGLGFLLKIMHWPFVKHFLTTGYVIFALVYPRYLLQRKPKTKLDPIKGLLVMMWAGSNIIYQFVFPSYSLQLSIISSVSFILFWVLFIVDFRSKKEVGLNNIVNVMFVIGGVNVVMALALRFFDASGATLLLVVGVIILLITLFIMLFIQKDE